MSFWHDDGSSAASQALQATQKGPKACTTCAKAKARCIPRADGGDKCERCFRLSKECFSRPPAPPRIKKRPKRSRVAELEKRLNELSSQFEGQHAAVPSAPSATTRTASVSDAGATPKPARPLKAPERGDALTFEHLFPSPQSSGPETNDTTDWGPEALRPGDSAWPLPGEADMLLLQYHELFAPLCPFVVVPKHLSAAELRAERPFLWKGVMTASSIWDGSRQAKMGDEMLADIGRAAIADGNKSLDLLQGLLLLTSWFYFGLKSSQTTHLLFLARSLCINLNTMTCGFGGEPMYGQFDHVRAYAGMYYLNAVIFTTNKRTDVFLNPAQVQSYCKILETAKEYPSDEFLIKLVQIQQLAQSIAQTMSLDPAMPALSLPLAMVIESFKDQLDTFRVTLPAHLASNPALQCHISVAEMLLNDVAISDGHCESANLPLPNRLQLLWSCVRSVREFFKVRFAESELVQPRFMTVFVSDVAFAFISGIKLLTLQVPGWNVEEVGKELAINNTLGQQIHDLTQIIARRKSSLLSTDSAALEDPLERLLRLLRTAQELVGLQLSGLTGLDIAQAVVGDMNSASWQDMMNDATSISF
ncbi:hypothetical protein HIM_06528 [Hirsutella minnesotensis 3608]|uniref:Zn(2)-C6 fungal-type domain-containing protein n=1 Tax=Hirsutella minnesotensis 3608 TaxID=1043627 RepID=A0A0F8A4S3_9HYPO|nr:hypothetical protein HIM_06528 [Hirsutella minnesotensis 3608]